MCLGQISQQSVLVGAKFLTFFGTREGAGGGGIEERDTGCARLAVAVLLYLLRSIILVFVRNVWKFLGTFLRGVSAGGQEKAPLRCPLCMSKHAAKLSGVSVHVRRDKVRGGVFFLSLELRSSVPAVSATLLWC